MIVDKHPVNTPWFTLREDETLDWYGHPSILPRLDNILGPLLLPIGGLLLLFVIDLPGMVGAEFAKYAYVIIGIIYVIIGIMFLMGFAGSLAAYLKVKWTYYVVTDERVVKKEVTPLLVTRDWDKLEHADINYTDPNQNKLYERLLGIGDIALASAGTGDAEMYLDDVPHVFEIYDKIDAYGAEPDEVKVVSDSSDTGNQSEEPTGNDNTDETSETTEETSDEEETEGTGEEE